MNWTEPSKSGASIDNGTVNIKETRLLFTYFQVLKAQTTDV